MPHTRPYLKPKRIWNDGAEVFVEAYDGMILHLTPQVALHLSRKLGVVAGDALVYQVTHHETGEAPTRRDDSER